MPDGERPLLFSFGGIDGGPRVEIAVSDDHMTVWGTFYSAKDLDGKLLVWSEFQAALQGAGIIEGVRDREVQDTIFRFNTSHPSPERVVLARGRPPVAERPAFLKLESKFYDHHFTDRGGAQVDFKEFSPFLIVKKGELLARAILPRTGVPGVTVYGADIPAGKKDIRHVRPGAHTLFAHGKVFSRISGRFTLVGDVFDVSDVLELEAGVGYGTGNLTFPGSVIVKGVVSDGFRLAAGGHITVKGPLDASEVLCHGDLICEGGIIGKRPGLVRVGGTVRSLYVEHCQVEALGSLWITKALLHAQIFTNGDLFLEEGSRIVASTVWVKGNLTCGQLGGENGPSKVVAGSDFVVQRKMEAIRQKYQVLERQVLKEKSQGKEPTAPVVAELQALIADLNTLTPQLFSHPTTEIRVTQKVFEGTVIEMGFASMTVPRETKGQVFRLSADGKTITASALARDSKESVPPT